MVDCFPVASWVFCPVASRPRFHILSYGPLSLASSAASVSSNATLRLLLLIQAGMELSPLFAICGIRCSCCRDLVDALRVANVLALLCCFGNQLADSLGVSWTRIGSPVFSSYCRISRCWLLAI
ncbi:hypothetical protein Nepgr_020423 [Nepenthes gracilis]|uniref:Uncharacterized protein n=1 Tax=Nepenthes gracilis TaxID=150966 RepID=A0AAD3XV22_NEPGR|nr:hypothetical protein Nepgr_020423 [Nepenthes gracilis]